MHADACRIANALDAWRAQGADRIAPVRFHYIDALRQRMQQMDGDARHTLHGRLDALLAAYAEVVATATATQGKTPAAAPDGGDTLASLTRLLAEHEKHGGATPPRDAGTPAPLPQMDALADARRIWSDVRTRSQVRQSLEQTAEDAGPLNSSRLVHRAIQTMGDCSPAYREHFLVYLDTLSWLQQLGQHGALVDHDPSPPAARKPRKPRKPRSKSSSSGEA